MSQYTPQPEPRWALTPQEQPAIAEPEVDTTPRTTYLVADETALEKPYRVIIENDDVTPMEFVVVVLRIFFGLDIERAYEVMLTAHNEGEAYVASYPYEEAQERVYAAHDLARAEGYPLTFHLEPEE